MLHDPILRKGVAAGVISAVIVLLFVQPVLNSTWPIIERLTFDVWGGISDRMYQNASLGLRNWVDVVFALGLGAAITGGLFGSTVAVLSRRSRSSGSIARLGRKLLLGGFGPVAVILLNFAALLGLLSQGYMIIGDLQLNASFNQRLSVIAPSISDQEEEELVAMWASMDQRSDYLVINEVLSSLATSRGVKLPEPLWK